MRTSQHRDNRQQVEADGAAMAPRVRPENLLLDEHHPAADRPRWSSGTHHDAVW